MSKCCSSVDEKRLKNWKRWLEEWDKMQKRIAEKLKVLPSNLISNYSTEINTINQEKLVLDYAKIPTNFDKYRGKPSFYNVPEALPIRDRCHQKEPVYFMRETKKEKLEVPGLECVGMPNYIVQTEKNIINETRNIYKRWQNSAYRQQQMKIWSPKIKKIVPHWPSFENLIVLGQKIDTKNDIKNSKTLYKEISVEETIAENNISTEVVAVSKTPRLSLKINNIIFDTSFCEKNKKIYIAYDYDITADTIATDYIDLENIGCATLRISFIKLESHQLFRHFINESNCKSGFFFNHKELLLLPGQKIQFPIWFTTNSRGFCKENWIISTKPQFWREQFPVTLCLRSYAYFKSIQNEIEKIQTYIDVQAKNVFIKNASHRIFEEMKFEDTPITPFQFNEKHLFELANIVNNRPLYLYDKEVIKSLKIFHSKINHKNEWNYSINALTQLAHEDDVGNYLQRKMLETTKFLEKVEERAKTDVKSAPESKNHSPNRSKKTKQLKKTDLNLEDIESLEQANSKSFIYSCQSELDSLVRQLYSPIMINTEREKYIVATQVFSVYFSKMGSLLLELEKEKNIHVIKNYPVYKHKLIALDQYPSRLVFENYSSQFLAPRQEEAEEKNYNDREKPTKIRNISENDIELLHSTYYNTTLTNKEKDKNKNKKSKTTATQSKHKQKKIKSTLNSKTSKSQISIESLDPFAEEFEYEPEIEIVEQEINNECSLVDLSSQDLEDYNLKQYIIVYSCLREAVEALVSAVDSVACTVSYATLAELKKSLLI